MKGVTEPKQAVPPATDSGGPFTGYAPPDERPPFATYAVLAGLFNLLFAAAVGLFLRRGCELPERIGAADVATIGVASHKLSRLIAKDKVTTPFRAPFAEFEEKSGPAEVSEQSRGTGVRRAIGNMITCPFCLDMWIVGAFTVGLLYAPRITRLVGTVFSALTISDFFQIAYKAAQDKGLD